MLQRLFETLLLPPASALCLWLLGTLLRRPQSRLPRPRLGRALQVSALLMLWCASTPFVGKALLHTLQTAPALPAAGALPEAQAIVVLSAEADRAGGEYGGATVGPMTLQRLRYAAALQRRTGLPLLVSGGVPGSDLPPLAGMMADVCRNEFGVPVRWVEDRSTDTWENADFSAHMLRADGVQRILLVSSAWHLPRAMASFAAQGLDVIPAPTAFRPPPFDGWASLLPHWSGLRDTSLAMHEWAGLFAYRLLH